ncbi:DUF2063 domain-containing protein [Legionella jordanis]|uniref:HvfC/BufC N-terminal domain-containing protein n=1 Tax=Legionella jordanis TaxID=456 RepID=UPI000EFFDE0A|nr:putative DNA-binding domain-containing protein [Legionella jordanis]RMX20907.1 DUF2063 domain-containing protein [Legionella jordanis]
MNELGRLQESFQAYLMTGEKFALSQAIVDSGMITVAKRLDIYRDAYRSRLIECLSSNYPVCRQYFGDEQFLQLAHSYIDAYPSFFRSIRWYGDCLSTHLAEYSSTQPHWVELAQFEWQLNLAFDATDASVLSIDHMTAIQPEHWAEMTFSPHPSLHLLKFAWNTVAIWQAIANNKQPEPVQKNNKSTTWVIWRHNYSSRFYCLAEDESWALNALVKGANFAEICAGLNEWMSEEEVGLRAASLLKGWIQSGLLSRVTFKDGKNE